MIVDGGLNGPTCSNLSPGGAWSWTFPRLTGPLCPTQTGDILPSTNSQANTIRSDSLHFQDVHEQGALLGHAVAATTPIGVSKRAYAPSDDRRRLGIKFARDSNGAKEIPMSLGSTCQSYPDPCSRTIWPV
jgi:hypothetical protein